MAGLRSAIRDLLQDLTSAPYFSVFFHQIYPHTQPMIEFWVFLRISLTGGEPVTQSYSHHAFARQSTALKMNWTIENGRLQAKWTARQPELLKPNVSKRAPYLENSGRHRAMRAA